MQQMADAGAPMAAIVLAVRAIEERDQADAERRAKAAERKRNERERRRLEREELKRQSRDSHATVTGLSGDPYLDGSPPSPLLNPNQVITPLSPPKKAKGKRSKLEFEPPDWVPLEPWQAFVEHRQAMRSIPFTAAAAQGVVSKMDDLRGQGHCPEKLLRKAVMHGWRTVFEAEDTKGYSARAGPIDMGEYKDRLARIGQSDATH